MLIAISWFRMGFFPQYAPPWVSKSYVILVGFATVVVGLALERAFRRNVKAHP